SKLYHNFFHPLSVTLDENRALVVWWASVGKTGALRGRLISDSGRPLAPPFYVTVQLQHRVFNPTLTRLQNGNVLASWDLHTKRRVKSEVMARLFSNRARPLGPAFVVNTYRKGNQVRPTVAALPHGAFAIAWQSDGQDGDGAGVYCQRFRANGRHEGGETRVARMIEGDQLAPRIAGFETDHLLVLWTHREPSLRQLSMRVLEPFRFPL
ncbi:MAG: hypothetical protein KC609_00580, partial [Myxococcales bacterium]|nr:hypothetical protein [Myxococcales bacterium]